MKRYQPRSEIVKKILQMGLVYPYIFRVIPSKQHTNIKKIRRNFQNQTKLFYRQKILHTNLWMVAPELSRNILLAIIILIGLIRENPFYTTFWSIEFSAFINYSEKHSSLFPTFYPVLRFCHQCSNAQMLPWEKWVDPSLFLQLGDWAERNAAVLLLYTEII